MNRKMTVFATITLVLLTVVGAIAVMAQRTHDPATNPDVVDLSQIKEDAIRNLFDSAGRMIDPKQELAKVASDHEGGFGGYYVHETDKTIVFVYMEDVTKTASAEAAFRAAYRSGSREITQIIPVQGRYSFDQLVEWYDILDRALSESDIYPSTGGVRVLENRIRMGLLDAALIDDALKIMEGLGIPEGAVTLEERGYDRLLAK